MKLSIITVTHHRPELFSQKALASIFAQTDCSFEWIVINDGADPATSALIQSLDPNFGLIYRDMPHPSEGFGLSHGRNLGLSLASSEVVTYLDDDNQFDPDFVSETIKFYQDHSNCSYSMTTQRRNRHVLKDGQIVKAGREFISPEKNCTLTDLVTHQQLFDSNGFSHLRFAAPDWNPNLRIYVDYDYLLRCISLWGRSSFLLNSQVLVDYTQTNEGVIGRSSYQDWGEELEQIYQNLANYKVLLSYEVDILRSLIAKYKRSSYGTDNNSFFLAR